MENIWNFMSDDEKIQLAIIVSEDDIDINSFKIFKERVYCKKTTGALIGFHVGYSGDRYGIGHLFWERFVADELDFNQRNSIPIYHPLKAAEYLSQLSKKFDKKIKPTPDTTTEES